MTPVCLIDSRNEFHLSSVYESMNAIHRFSSKQETDKGSFFHFELNTWPTVPRQCFFSGFFFVINVSCLSCCLVCSLQPCGHLLGKG